MIEGEDDAILGPALVAAAIIELDAEAGIADFNLRFRDRVIVQCAQGENDPIGVARRTGPLARFVPPKPSLLIL